jgi:hypothetical protein
MKKIYSTLILLIIYTLCGGGAVWCWRWRERYWYCMCSSSSCRSGKVGTVAVFGCKFFVVKIIIWTRFSHLIMFRTNYLSLIIINYCRFEIDDLQGDDQKTLMCNVSCNTRSRLLSITWSRQLFLGQQKIKKSLLQISYYFFTAFFFDVHNFLILEDHIDRCACLLKELALSMYFLLWVSKKEQINHWCNLNACINYALFVSKVSSKVQKLFTLGCHGRTWYCYTNLLVAVNFF